MLDTWEPRILNRNILEKAVRFTMVIDMVMGVLKNLQSPRLRRDVAHQGHLHVLL